MVYLYNLQKYPSLKCVASMGFSLLLVLGLLAITSSAVNLQEQKDELTILEENCTTMRSGLVRHVPGSNHMEVCTKHQWTPFNPAKRLRTGLVGHWKMDEISGDNVDDDSGHENHGTASNAAAGRGKFTRGRVINAKDGGITIPDSPSLDFGTNSFSVAGWQLINNVVYPQTTFSVQKGKGCWNLGASSSGWDPGFEIAHGYVATGTRVCIRDKYNNQVLANLAHDTPYAPPKLLRKWTHYCFVFDRTPGVMKITLYLNGRKQDKTVNISKVTGPIGNSKPLVFGTQYGWQTKGTLDEYRVYNYALNADEVNLLYSDHTV